ncbi:MAG TPA: hypothetical protein VN618_00340 [Solirubrobacteraceae bacterium]|nr:hypothetical protein [Solirubrobacteraceae bacterium]
MTLAMSTPAYVATAAALLLVALAVRLIGFWLIRKGGAMERARHGVLPGVGSAPRRPDLADEPPRKAPPEPERYDPFNAG